MQQNTEKTTLVQCIERARKILQFEQRTNHQDQAVKPGGLASFITRWADEATAICEREGRDVRPIYSITEYLEGYHRQDPMQRAASIRSVLSALTEMSSDTVHHSSSMQEAHTSTRDTSSTQSTYAVQTHSQQRGNNAHSSSTTPIASQPAKTAPHSHDASMAASASALQKEPVKAVTQSHKPKREEPSTSDFVHLEAGMSKGHATMTLLTADITAIPGVGPSIAAKLNALGIRTVGDLLFYFPREHRDYSKLEKIANIQSGQVVTTMGMIWEVETKRLNNSRTITYATISDDTGKLRVSWFNQAYLQKQLQSAKGSYLVVTGTKQRFGNKVEFQVRSYEFPDQGDLLNTGILVPTYPLTEGLHAKTLRRFTKWAVDRYAKMLPEHLPTQIRMAGHLLSLPEAVAQFHYPENEQMLEAARRRLAFDELFLIQLGMQERRSRWKQQVDKGNAFTIDLSRIFVEPSSQVSAASSRRTVHDLSQRDNEKRNEAPAPMPEETIGTTLWSMAASEKPFEETLPFKFTDAQKRVLHEIFGDLSRTQPMCRLLQGDVGAGKTAVAAAALFVAALNGYQGAIMAPTELLAEQHARSIGAMLEPFGIRTVLLTGSLRPKERAMGRAMLENGEAAVAIGTHALIQEDVAFHKLGLVIVDEQHRFGVEQRDALRKKGYHPHMLVMTATPIPRTLALTLYGDLDVSIIDQLPPGRQKIITRWRAGARRSESYTTIVHQVEEGHQAFIICPLIEESESLAVKAATVEYERLKREVFPYKRLGLLHGAMKAAEKDAVMRQFRDHELDILVATSVIEVGIDIPNATVMVIEDADRFGLSQLHQFRGRVGRGKAQSYCYVLSADAGLNAQERLGIFEETDDGFRLAEEDLRIRGAGDFFGVRQSGMPTLKFANLNDTSMVELARSLADKLWESDPYLRKSEHKALREKMSIFWNSFVGH